MPNRTILIATLNLAVAVWLVPDPVGAEGWWPRQWSPSWATREESSSAMNRRSEDVERRQTSERDGRASICRRWARCMRTWSLSREQPVYGLSLVPELDSTGRLIIFLHGYNSRPEDMKGLIHVAAEAGHVCATYRYPNDQSIQRSAEQLSADLSRLAEKKPTVSVCLVAHSMGGLVARAAIEDPALDPSNVRRLVMVAPPNHGSHLARYACSLDVWEYLCSDVRRTESGLIAGSFRDGFAEATSDLQPGSKFLSRLNGRGRNPHVRYSLFIGTSGLVSRDRFVRCERLLRQAGKHCRWMLFAHRQFNRHVMATEELFDGKGDGVVAVRSAQLDGVDDVVIDCFSHAGILTDDSDPEVARIRAEIVSRL